MMNSTNKFCARSDRKQTLVFVNHILTSSTKTMASPSVRQLAALLDNFCTALCFRAGRFVIFLLSFVSVENSSEMSR